MRHRRFASLMLATAVLAALLLAASGAGYRHDVWTLRTAFTMLRWAAYVAVGVGALSLVGMLVSRPVGRATVVLGVALAVAAATAGIPWRLKQRASQVPPIHDVTTDTQDPPQFVAVLPLRAGAKNSAAYGGDSVAALQRSGYPDLAPVISELSPAAAFARARTTAAEIGWTLVAADSVAGRIEATATTRWFGFKDDVVVRVRPEGAGSRVDVRSVSRVGGSDVGANAARVRAFVARMSRISPPA